MERNDRQHIAIDWQFTTCRSGPFNTCFYAFYILVVSDEHCDDSVWHQDRTTVPDVGNAGSAIDQHEVIFVAPFVS